MLLAAAIQAVKTASHQTEVVGGYTVLRTNKPRDTLRCLGDWTNALIRKYSHLTVSCIIYHISPVLCLPDLTSLVLKG